MNNITGKVMEIVGDSLDFTGGTLNTDTWQKKHKSCYLGNEYT